MDEEQGQDASKRIQLQDNAVISTCIDSEVKGTQIRISRDFSSPSLVEACVGQQVISTKQEEPETYFEYSNEEEIQIRETEHRHLLETGHFNQDDSPADINVHIIE